VSTDPKLSIINFSSEEFEMTHDKKDAPSAVSEGMKLLAEQRPLDLKNIKDSCDVELQRFIKMRGTIDSETGKIHLPLIAKSDKAATIKVAYDIMQRLKAATSLDAMRSVLQDAPMIEVDFEAVIGKCLTIMEIAQKIPGYNF
jgi:hypothetical protein